MLSGQVISASLAVEKAMYRVLIELEEITGELASAVERRDQVATRMFLSLRREQIERLTAQHATLQRQCAELPQSEGVMLHKILWDRETPVCDGAEELEKQVVRNRTLLERIIAADRKISRSLGGESSFYTSDKTP